MKCSTEFNPSFLRKLFGAQSRLFLKDAYETEVIEPQPTIVSFFIFRRRSGESPFRVSEMFVLYHLQIWHFCILCSQFIYYHCDRKIYLSMMSVDVTSVGCAKQTWIYISCVTGKAVQLRAEKFAVFERDGEPLAKANALMFCNHVSLTYYCNWILVTKKCIIVQSFRNAETFLRLT